MCVYSRFLCFLIFVLSVTSCAWHRLPDTNIYGTVTSGGCPLSGVVVSDGFVFATTDSMGRFEMSSSKRSRTVFVVTPSGYQAVCRRGTIVPSFWQAVSSDSTKVERCDFELVQVRDSLYSVIFLTDCHLCNDYPVKPDFEFFDSLVIPTYNSLYDSLAVRGPVYTINLGDLSHDRYWYSNNFNLSDAYAYIVKAGIKAPLYSITGNHDHDPAVTNPDLRKEEFEAQHVYREVFGPDRYSMNIGEDHWIFMDNMQYVNTPDSSVSYKGVAGLRNYDVCYSSEQMDWLEKDLSFVEPNSTIYICSHAPLFDNRGYCHPESQLRLIDSLAASKGCFIEFYSGHVHRMENAVRPEFPHISVHALPAVSGNMWECRRGEKVLGLDGCAGGLEYIEMGGEATRRDYVTYGQEGPYWRLYDMNTLRQRWLNSSQCQWIADEIDGYVDYTDEAYRNGILVNYWWRSEGDRIEIYENGRKLDVTKAPFSVDPAELEGHYNFRKERYIGRHICPADIELSMANLFYAKATRADSKIVVRAIDSHGKLITEQEFSREKLDN